MTPAQWEAEIRLAIGPVEQDVVVAFTEDGTARVYVDHLGENEMPFLEKLVLDLDQIGITGRVVGFGYSGRRDHEVHVSPPPGGIAPDHTHEIVDGSTPMHEDPYADGGRFTAEELEEHVRTEHRADREFSDFEQIVGWHTRAHPDLAATAKRSEHEMRRDFSLAFADRGDAPVMVDPQQIVQDANLVGAGPYVLTVEYAYAERGYEDLAEWTRDRSAAHREAHTYENTGLDVRVITRVTLTSGWAEDPVDADVSS